MKKLKKKKSSWQVQAEVLPQVLIMPALTN